jgi:regulator of replication initiation timing
MEHSIDKVSRDLKDWGLQPYTVFPPVARVAQDTQQLLTQISVTLEHDKKREAENERLRAENLTLHKKIYENEAYIKAHNALATHAQNTQDNGGIFRGLFRGRKKPHLVPMHQPSPPANITYNIDNYTNAKQAVGNLQLELGVGVGAAKMVIGQAGPVLKAVAEYQNHKKKGRRDANL